MQSALLLFKSGLGSAADLSLGGFDSHDQHDAVSEALLTHFAMQFVFSGITAEHWVSPRRIVLVVGSDFGRTNFYNEGEGKDHWPISSYLLWNGMRPGVIALWG